MAKSASDAVAKRRDVRSVIRNGLVEAFYAAHAGYSIDYLLAEPRLQSAFHHGCVEAGLIGGPTDWNRELLRLRKMGAFPRRGEIKKVYVADNELEAYTFAAEIAWQQMSDRFGGASIDEILCDPEKAGIFDRIAKKFAPGFAPSQYRWAALRLRKASRDLVDEAKRYHFMFTKRDFTRFQLWDRLKPARYAGQPGIYLLRGEAKQPLFIGYSLDLGRRAQTHADCRALADMVEHVAVIAAEELPSAEYRQALKVDLVRRHSPKWNVNLVGLSANP